MCGNYVEDLESILEAKNKRLSEALTKLDEQDLRIEALEQEIQRLNMEICSKEFETQTMTPLRVDGGA